MAKKDNKDATLNWVALFNSVGKDGYRIGDKKISMGTDFDITFGYHFVLCAEIRGATGWVSTSDTDRQSMTSKTFFKNQNELGKGFRGPKRLL